MSPLKRSQPFPGVAAIALIVGSVIGYVDSRITWDDAGVTAGVLIFASAIMAAVRRQSWWLIGLLTGLPALVFNVVKYGRFEAVFAVVVSVVGAALGALAGRAASRYPPKMPRE